VARENENATEKRKKFEQPNKIIRNIFECDILNLVKDQESLAKDIEEMIKKAHH